MTGVLTDIRVRAVFLAAMALTGVLAGAVPIAAASQAKLPDPGTLLQMVRVRGGTFQMGDLRGVGRSDERPVHVVTVSDFFLSKYEITVGQFRMFAEETGYRTSAERQGGWLVWTGRIWERKYNASWRNPYFPQTDRDPVVMVSWNDAVAFCDWLSRREGRAPFYYIGSAASGGTGPAEDWSSGGYRLPTEAEWEYGARSGGRDVEYAWGEGVPMTDGRPMANVADETLRAAFPAWPFATWPGYADGFVYTAPVGSYPANGLGLCDMSGNVWEWCNDWYGSYPGEDQVDPRGPATGVTRCLRGGGWTDEPGALRVSFRGGRLPDGRGVNGGFRPAVSER